MKLSLARIRLGVHSDPPNSDAPAHPAVEQFTKLARAVQANDHQAARAAIRALRTLGYSVVLLGNGGAP